VTVATGDESGRGDRNDGRVTIGGGSVGGSIGSDAGTRGAMGMCAAGVGGRSGREGPGADLGNVDDANEMLDVQSRGAGVAESAGDDELR
jgi:hypothetical protein